QVYTSVSILHFECGGVSLNAIRMQQVCAHQWVLVLRIRGQNAATESVRCFECRAAFEHDDRVVRKSGNGGVGWMLQIDTQQGCGAVEILRFEAGQDILDGQAEVLDRVKGSVVKRDKNSAILHKLSKCGGAGRSNSSFKLAGDGSRAESVANLLWRR